MRTMKAQFLVLHLAVGLTFTQFAECFSSDIDDIDMSGLALFTAAKDGDITVVRAELAKGIDPDWRMKLGDIFGDDDSGLGAIFNLATQLTPLMAAVQFGHYNIVELLIDRKADVNLRGPVGMSPISMAAGFNQPAIAQLLLRSGADPKQKDDLGKTAIDYARVKGHNRLANIIEDFIREEERDLYYANKIDGVVPSSVTKIMVHWVLMCKLFCLLFLFY